MKTFLFLAALAAALMAPTLGWTQQRTVGEGLNAQDRQFLKEAGQGNAGEIALGQLASEKAQHETVKEFGRWMASAHGFASRELATITKRMHGKKPATSLEPDAQATRQKLQGLSGAQFDQAYLQGMIQDHQKDLRDFGQEARGGQDTLVRTFAENMIPAIQEHLREAQDLHRDLFGGGPAGAGAAANAGVQGTQGTPK